MLHGSKTNRTGEQGFTLVELAIVMVIIGLLIGGILKGQELINNARLSATVTQLKSSDAAINGFQDKYAALPGDIATPATRLPNCAAAPCNAAGTGGTIGNGRIEGGSPLDTPAAANEAGLAFVHLAAADFVSGINPNGGRTFGGQFPVSKAGGGMWVSFADAAADLTGTALPIGRHYATLSGAIGTVDAGNGGYTATSAAQMDRKLDDGLPQTGTFQTLGTGCFTGTGTAAIYAEAGNAGTCTSIIRILN